MPHAEELINKLQTELDKITDKRNLVHVKFDKETQEISVELHYKARFKKALYSFPREETKLKCVARECLNAVFQQMYNDTLDYIPTEVSIVKVKDALQLIRNLEYDDLENAINISRYPDRPSSKELVRRRHGRKIVNDIKTKLGQVLNKFFPKETLL